MGYPPWLMWGTSNQIRASTTLGAGQGRFSQQLARIDYARPETWHFLFWAQLNDYQGLLGSKCDLYFDLILGLGRSSVRLDGFEHFVFENAAGTPPDKGMVIFSTQSQGPERVASDPVPNIIDDFPAQSINCVCRAFVSIGSGASILADLTVSVAFSPKTHVRPEWWKSGGPIDTTRFRGGEQAGT